MADLRWRPTLIAAFATMGACLLVLSTVMAVHLTTMVDRAVDENAHAVAEVTGRLVSQRVEQHLAGAEWAIRALEAGLVSGTVDGNDPQAVAHVLVAVLSAQTELLDASWTTAARGTPWQLTAIRLPDLLGTLAVRQISGNGTTFLSQSMALSPLPLPESLAPGIASDPTEHPTYTTAILPEFAKQILWSDLSYAQFSDHLPQPARPVGVYAMKAVHAADGHTLGVIRAGLATHTLDEILHEASEGPLRVTLADAQGRPVTRLAPDDPIVETDDDNLRIAPRHRDPLVMMALASPVLQRVSDTTPIVSDAFSTPDGRCLVTAQQLPNTQDWRVVVAVSEMQLPGLPAILAARQRTGALLAALLGLAALFGLGSLRVLQRGLGGIVRTAESMRRMRFAPETGTSFFRDVEAALQSLERAKTAGRAMGRYIPVDLVRDLFQANTEPKLGGELRDVTILFTDIAGFTTISEHLPPDELAALLGQYLQVVTEVVHRHGGMIDKFIGDAVMAIWNAPSPCDNHPLAASRAVLDCQSALDTLFASPDWPPGQPWQTRFGLHRARVMVGHFGAPDRMSYTALGDGVNVASRLEGLNKVYGTTVIGSADVARATGEELLWRQLDCVAVVGRREGLDVYELLGARGATDVADAHLAAYAAALTRYVHRDFTAAAADFAALDGDAPAKAMAERCRRYAASPPGPDWDGVYVAEGK